VGGSPTTPMAYGVAGEPPHGLGWLAGHPISLSLILYILLQWQDFCSWPNAYTSLQLDRFRRMVTPKFPSDLALSHSPSRPIRCIHSTIHIRVFLDLIRTGKLQALGSLMSCFASLLCVCPVEFIKMSTIRSVLFGSFPPLS
jgi:hypothetical protein